MFEIEESATLTIKPLDKQVVQKGILPDPKSTFVWLISGHKGQGKSTTIINYLTSKEFFLGKFDRIYMAVATAYQDPKWDDNLNLEEIDGIMTEWDHETFKEWYDETCDIVETTRSKAKAKNKKIRIPLTCVIIDDMATDLKNSKTLQKWILNSRHCKTSFFISSQKVSFFQTAIRENADIYQFYQPNTLLELDYIKTNILLPYMSKKDADDLLEKVWEKKTDFLYVNTRLPKEKMFFKNFQQIHYKKNVSNNKE